MSIDVSAIVCTHNPRDDHLRRTLSGLRRQSLDDDRWELLIIDNASDAQLADQIDVSWHPNGRVVREDQVGLTHARLRSFHEAEASLLVYIDDDNVLAPTYLERVVELFEKYSGVGALGGKALPEYEVDPPSWFDKVGMDLGCRDLGGEVQTASWTDVPVDERTYPECAPIGAGLAIRREAYQTYVESAARDARRTALGRAGESLASGEDNDIVMTLLEEGWSVGYFPSLELTHLIPKERVMPDYLAEMAESSNKTWVTVLDVHDIRPWPPIFEWTVPLRKMRAYLMTRAWKGPLERIKWGGACGQFEGQALLSGKTGSHSSNPSGVNEVQ
ncbi:glycosyltransferase [Salinibacter grassmerensis]|uniref:glycosyltransferase n=1 Tax=Salinibacter grassmerensis TaxID=3040353 RepID=UPI0021E7DDFC|nr:glycosyltransferase [Salinibacter grassmerensis]